MKKITLISLMLLVPFVATAGKVEPPRGKVLTEHATPLGSPRSGLNPLGDPDTVAPMSAGTWHGISFGTSGACSSPFTGFPVTFDDTTGSCTSESTAVFSTAGGGPVNCDYTTTVIEGTESAYIDGGVIYFSFGKTITTPVRVAWYYQSVSQFANGIRFQLAQNTNGRNPRVYAPWTQPTTGAFALFDVGESPTQLDVGSTTIVVGTSYKMCVEYDPSDDTTSFYLDASDGDWCAGALDTLTTDGLTSTTDANGFALQVTSDVDIVDEVTACDAP